MARPANFRWSVTGWVIPNTEVFSENGACSKEVLNKTVIEAVKKALTKDAEDISVFIMELKDE